MGVFERARQAVSVLGIKRAVLMVVTMLVLPDLTLPVVAQVENPGSLGNCTREAEPCKHGMVLPMWMPQGNLSHGDKAARAIVYFLSMMYFFLGVSIVADRFMAAIEVITSQEKEVVIKKADGEKTVVMVRIWNETVSNLTLMALGSSAPEILLAIIEVIHTQFKAGDLGPSTIVGSAAFNLFIIIAICVVVIPDGQVRKIKHLRVFIITASWSIFAYIWLYIILSFSSPGVVEVWEALLTFLFFPATVVTAYIADRKLLVYKLLSRKYRATHKGVVVTSEGLNDMELVDGKTNQLTEEPIFKGLDSDNPDVREFEQHRNEFIDILRELRAKHPNVDMRTLEEMAELEAVNRGPKSRAFYRIQATRKLTGGGKMIKKARIERRASLQDVSVADKEDHDGITRVFFNPGHYTVLENVGTFAVTVTRQGGDMDKTLYVDYNTDDGSANAGSDYLAAEGTLVFQPGEKHKQFSITIIDDDVFEEDEHFYVRLSNLRVGDAEGMFESSQGQAVAQLTPPFLATVMILDDDHPGIFHFEDGDMSVTENIGELMVKVVRSSGARGCVVVPFHAVDGTALAGKDFEILTGELYFDNDETEQYIKIHIVDDEEYEKTESFAIELGEPYMVKKGSVRKDGVITGREVEERLLDLAKPRKGDTARIVIIIKESQEFKSVVDKLLKKANTSLVVGTSSWREQFMEAITVSAGDEEDDGVEETEEKLPSCLDYVMHFLTLFWKVLFALIPPTDYCGGWACFVVSILMIAILTAVIGDLAASFGCTVGLKDSITAISFVALGTSIPDTFASKVSAINDRYADSSIGNVTGSNAVNVFLGIGIAWSMAAIYHASNGNKFYVNPGTLALSVTVFCIMAFFCVIILVLRRRPSIGGELGGPTGTKWATAIVLSIFWLIYLILSSLVSYCHIPGF